MRVFVSWSGPRSQKVGEALSKFIRRVLQRTEPWYSKNSIRSGRLAYDELVKALNGTKFGILCVTADNWEKPWLNFEAGALLRSVEATQVTPYLLDLKPGQLVPPLNLFQARVFEKVDTLELCRDINNALGSDALSPDELQDSFEKWWPELEGQLLAIEKTDAKPPEPPSAPELMEQLRVMLSQALQSASGIGNNISSPPDEVPFALIEQLSQVTSTISNSPEYYSELSDEDLTMLNERFTKLIGICSSRLSKSKSVVIRNELSRILQRYQQLSQRSQAEVARRSSADEG